MCPYPTRTTARSRSPRRSPPQAASNRSRRLANNSEVPTACAWCCPWARSILRKAVATASGRCRVRVSEQAMGRGRYSGDGPLDARGCFSPAISSTYNAIFLDCDCKGSDLFPAHQASKKLKRAVGTNCVFGTGLWTTVPDGLPNWPFCAHIEIFVIPMGIIIYQNGKFKPYCGRLHR